jgi:peptidyl-prolyl cis-trans isomerase SurA
VEQQVMQAVYVQAMEPALRTYLTKLREDAYIAIKPGYVDSGASPNEKESDLVFTAYTPPAPKKKVVVQKARLDRSGRVIAASGKATAPTATPAVAISNGMAAPSASTGTVVNGKKPKKVKREKVRFGQAPRTTLGAGAADETAATDSSGAAATSVPGDAMAPAGNALVAENTVDANVNPLEPQAPPQKKTRFAKTEPYHGTPRPKKLSAMAKEKAIAKPTPLSTDEKQTQQVQAAPLGLNGDTAKKKTKPKKVKGTPKERLKEKPVETPAPVDQTVAPPLVPPIPGTTPTPPAPAPAAK